MIFLEGRIRILSPAIVNRNILDPNYGRRHFVRGWWGRIHKQIALLNPPYCKKLLTPLTHLSKIEKIYFCYTLTYTHEPIYFYLALITIYPISMAGGYITNWIHT